MMRTPMPVRDRAEPLRAPMRPLADVIHEEQKGTWRDVPMLLGRSFQLVWKAGRTEFLLTSALQLCSAVGLAAQLFVAKALFDAILGAGGGRGSFTSILPELAAMAALTVALDVLQALRTEQARILGELVGRRALDRIMDVSTRVDLLAFESADFYDRLRRAQATGPFRALQIAQGSVGLAGAMISAAGIVFALAALQPLLLPLVLVGYIPLWIVGQLNSRDFYRFGFQMTPNDRMRSYLQRIMLERDPAKEVRSFNLAPVVRRRYDRLYDERIRELRALARRRTIRSVIGSLAQSSLTALAIGGMAYLYVSGTIGLATGGAAVFGLYQLAGRLSAIHWNLNSLYESMLFVRDYESFLALEPALAAEPDTRAPRTFAKLDVDDVWFTYPEATQPALAGVSPEIRAGEIIALVGENGSGKTTLAKILAGLYHPQRGHVTWDGLDVNEVDRDDLRRSIAVIFQDFERYLLTASENVGFGRPERADDRDGIESAALRADAHAFINALPDGYDTMLGREWLGGYDLSIGQWQRVALARAFFRDAPFVILDEPTAALDARAESALFDRMGELLEGRSVVLISHRFSSVRSADRIYVLQHGVVTEQGTHAELMAHGGHYAELFTLQARAYIET
jgi:ATP-binding cassette subfamily B protein